MMTQRLIGAVLVAGSGTWVGQKARQKLRRHAALLEGLSAACTMMKSEVSFLHTPPEEMFSLLAKTGRPESEFFQRVSVLLKQKGSLAPAWQQAMEEMAESWGLSGLEQSELLRLGEALGRYDLEGAVAHLAAASDKFGQWGKEAAVKAQNDGKLLFTLWTLAGCMVAVLLM
jgi:stage III sporulation protein AB